MKKNTFRLFAIIALAMGMVLASCDPNENGNNGNNGNSGDPGTENPGNNSTVVYTNLESNPVTISEGDEYELNFGAHDFLIQNYGTYESFFAMMNPGSGCICTQGEWRGLVTPLEANTVIGSSSQFNMYDGQATFCEIFEEGAFETWTGKTAYIGFCFQQNGQTHYGWAKMKVTNNNGLTFTLYGYAYESTANKDIKAGQK